MSRRITWILRLERLEEDAEGKPTSWVITTHKFDQRELEQRRGETVLGAMKKQLVAMAGQLVDKAMGS